jgi:hypothetical protein
VCVVRCYSSCVKKKQKKTPGSGSLRPLALGELKKIQHNAITTHNAHMGQGQGGHLQSGCLLAISGRLSVRVYEGVRSWLWAQRTHKRLFGYMRSQPITKSSPLANANFLSIEGLYAVAGAST